MKITSCEITEEEREILKQIVRDKGCYFIYQCRECPLERVCRINGYIDPSTESDMAREYLSIARVVK